MLQRLLIVQVIPLDKLIPKDYAVLLNDIKQRVRSAQYEALKEVNKELIALYWDITHSDEF